jgi:hypothetical protein
MRKKEFAGEPSGEQVVTTQPEPKIHTEFEEKYLRCNLTPDEFEEHVGKLTQAIAKLDEAVQEKKVVMADLKSRVERATSDVGMENNIVRNRYEMRHVRCEAMYDYDKMRAVITRADTGEVLEERDMKQGERDRQAELFPPTAE